MVSKKGGKLIGIVFGNFSGSLRMYKERYSI